MQHVLLKRFPLADAIEKLGYDHQRLYAALETLNTIAADLRQALTPKESIAGAIPTNLRQAYALEELAEQMLATFDFFIDEHMRDLKKALDAAEECHTHVPLVPILSKIEKMSPIEAQAAGEQLRDELMRREN